MDCISGVSDPANLKICAQPLVAFANLQTLRNEPLARHTSARIGGAADWLVVVESREALIEAVQAAQACQLPWRILGGGSNLLVADAGVRGLVIINKTRKLVFQEGGHVYAESGVNLSSLARSCITRGLAGLEWAANVPGTVGGAVVGNAGAHGGDVASVLESAVLFDPARREGTVVEWSVKQFEYGYRDSLLKRIARGRAPHAATRTVLAAMFVLTPGDPVELARRADQFVARRKATQPPGASTGSMFKNPPGDYAGRLIEAAGLKGTQVGGAQISPLHANFFVNTGNATAADFKALIDLAREQVQRRFGVTLELEIELIGEWDL
jgi:UDP-N-acetylmuramate dehydrogenase